MLEVVTLMKGEWSFYINRKFNGGRMVMLWRWPVEWREHGHVTEVVTLMKGEWSFYINQKFNGWRMVMLRRWAVLRRMVML